MWIVKHAKASWEYAANMSLKAGVVRTQAQWSLFATEVISVQMKAGPALSDGKWRRNVRL